MSLETVEIAGALPFDVAEVKAALVVEHDEDDATLANLVADAIRQIENITRRTIRARTYRLILPRFSGVEIELQRPKCNAVTLVQYYDTAGDLQTLDAAVYDLDNVSEPAVLYLAEDQSWPATKARRDAVRINYTAGYNQGDDIPECIFTAVCVYVGSVVNDIAVPFDSIRDLVASITIPEFGG